MIDNYEKIKEELGAYDKNLSRKKEIIFFNKSDLVDKKDLVKKINTFKKKIKKKFEVISLFKKDDILKLKKALIKNVN